MLDRSFLFLGVMGLVGWMVPGAAMAGDWVRLADQIDAATETLQADSLPKFDAAATKVASQINVVRQFFESGTDPANRDRWMEFLDLQPIADAIEDEKSPAAIAREALDLRFRLIGLTPGLELTVLRTLRDDVNELVAAARFRNPQRALKALAKEMQSVATAIGDEQSPPAIDAVSPTATFPRQGTLSPKVKDRLAELVNLLIDANQTPALINQIRSRFDQPNLRLAFSEKIITDAAVRPANRRRNVNDCILGTRVIGRASVDGMVTADLLPSANGVRLQLTLNGRFASRNTGYNGPVTLGTVGRGVVMATRPLDITLQSTSLGPTYVRAEVKTNVVSITPKRRFGRRIVRRIASRRVAEQKPRADRIAVDRLRQEVGQEFIQSTADAANMSPPNLLARFKPQMQRLAVATPTRHLSSTSTEVRLQSRLSRSDQLAAASGPTIPLVAGDVTMSIHESLINNLASPVLAGRTLTQAELQRLIERSGLTLPGGKGELLDRDQDSDRDSDRDQDSESDEGEEPFEIEFARSRPILLEARDGRLRVGVRGARFAAGDRQLKQPLEITAVYAPVQTADGMVKLVRQGDGKVEFIGKRRLTIAQAGLRGTIEKRFADVFPDELLTRELTVPSSVKLKTLRGRSFRPVAMTIDRGWWTVSAR